MGQGMTQIPSVADGLLQATTAGGVAGLAVGSPAWFAWLADDAARSFSFRSPAGAYTARKERRQRGGAYWVAYRTAAGRQHKVYLGRSEDLTPDRLAEAAATLAGRVADAEPVGDTPTAPGAPPGRRGQGTAGLPLLATKLFVPRPRPDLVPRPRLLARLDAGPGAGRCTLLSAPAGAGKTSLLAAWLAQLDRPAAWLTLDERDQDAGQVLRYLVAALQTIAPACGHGAMAWLDAPQPPPPEVVVTDLVNDLAALPAPGLLVLDDYHLVRAPAVHAAVAFLLDHLPPALHLVIASREDPPLPLPRLRARRQLTEVRAADLGFSLEEAAAFLGAGMGLRLAEAQVAALVERTEGWAAGLQLAGLALRDRPDPAAFVAAFAGGHRLVADYLTAEVLDRQPAPTRRFLLATCVLDRLCAPLCDALLAPGAGDSQAVLEELERANLFLVPLDDERIWYRYHHLFADALRARLAREAGPEAVAALHRRASGWFGREGLLPEAIDHALAGDAAEDAATWIEALTPSMFATMSIHQPLAAWLAALPEPVVRARPLLCLAQAWLLIHRVELEPAAAWIDAAAQRAPGRRRRGPPRARRGRRHARLHGHRRAGRGAGARRRLGGAGAGRPRAGRRGLPRRRRPQPGAGRARAGPARPGRTGLRGGRGGRASGRPGPGQPDGDHPAGQRPATPRRPPAGAGHRPGGPGLGRRARRALDRWAADGRRWPTCCSMGTTWRRRCRWRPKGWPPRASSGTRRRWSCWRAFPWSGCVWPRATRPRRQPCWPRSGRSSSTGRSRWWRGCWRRPRRGCALALGDGAAAVAWATAVAWAAPVEPMALADVLRFGVAAVEAAAVTPARVLVVQGRATGDAALLGQAERHLEAAWELAEGQGLGWLRLRVLILRALLADAQGDRDAALASLAAAVAQAEPEGAIRPFLDEGGADGRAPGRPARGGGGGARAGGRRVAGRSRHPARRLRWPGGRAATRAGSSSR